jgi:Methylamine utilisation protein MauE
VTRRRIWAVLIVAELGLALGVGVGSDAAAYAAAILVAGFGAVLLLAVLGGRRGAPCGCFGPRSVVGWPAVVRSVVLSFAFAALPLLAGP